MSSAYHFSISNQLLYNKKAVYYSKNPLDLIGFENPYQYMLCVFKGQQKQIHWNYVSKIGVLFSCPHFSQIQINPVRLCSYIERRGIFETLLEVGVGKDSPYLGSPSFIHFIIGLLKVLYCLSNEIWKCIIMEECICS